MLRPASAPLQCMCLTAGRQETESVCPATGCSRPLVPHSPPLAHFHPTLVLRWWRFILCCGGGFAHGAVGEPAVEREEEAVDGSDDEADDRHIRGQAHLGEDEHTRHGSGEQPKPNRNDVQSRDAEMQAGDGLGASGSSGA